MASILYNIIIAPIELVVEIVFELMYRLVGQRETNQGLAVIGVSLAISLLTLPLYRRADAVQQKERDLQNKLSKWVTHIKKTFKGDERFMMLQTYYRQNGYSPLQALNGSVSLLLEIPFFIAAYHFLSHLQVLNEASFGFISDLGQPDRLIKIGKLSLNLLPILMTTINCISSAVYLKDFPLKDKIQTYGMALIFLVLLYNSPSGLVVYWTCNNIFSLGKNIFYKLKNPRRVLNWLSASVGTLFTIAILISGILNSKKKIAAVFLFLILTYLPLILTLLKKYFTKAGEKLKASSEDITVSNSPVIFILAGILLAIHTGILIPSSVISSSPAEFIDLQNYRNPLFFLVNSTCYGIGFFLLWAGIIRYMITDKYKKVIDFILWILAGIFLVDYMFFGKNLGVLSPLLVFEDGLMIQKSEKIINLICVIAVTGIFVFIYRFKKIIPLIITVFMLCISVLSINQISKTQNKLNEMAYIKNMKSDNKVEPLFSLSKSGKNVVVFMLDRAISGFVPYLIEEKPVLLEQYDGFTYYPNTLSHGGYTNYGAPGLFGGYEYTPTEMNKRDSELLRDKHDEALKVIPAIFDNNDYEVTVIDPPYAGYSWIPDLSIYDDYPDIKKYIVAGKLFNDSLMQQEMKNTLYQNNRNFFCYSIFKSMPLIIATVLYSKGNYFGTTSAFSGQTFYREISVLQFLPQLTKVTDEDKNTCLVIQNCTTHEPHMLQLPDYELKINVNNTGFKTAADGKIHMDTESQIIHYHGNMAALLTIGKWLDYLRKNNVYDNTRIIIVADHGRGLGHFDYMKMDNIGFDVELFNPLLLVKDFNEKGFKTSNEFMTNADTPTLATEGIIKNPVNPFTGKLINNAEKLNHPQIITTSKKWETTINNGTVFDTSDGHWYSVHDDIFKEENWKFIE